MSRDKKYDFAEEFPILFHRIKIKTFVTRSNIKQIITNASPVSMFKAMKNTQVSYKKLVLDVQEFFTFMTGGLGAGFKSSAPQH